MILRIDDIRAAIRSTEPLAIAVQMLVRARQYAERAKCNPWHFAIELEEFHRAGVCKIDLRWLLMADLVEHAQEAMNLNNSARKFERLPKHVVPVDACFILSDRGVARLAQLAQGTTGVSVGNNCAPKLENCCQPAPPLDVSMERPVPQWDATQKTLRFNGVVVKQFHYPAPNQETVLAAFQEEHWPRRIDDPLRPNSEQDTRRRLNDTIKCLNRKQATPFILFRGDGSGTGVVWQLRTG